MYDATFFYFISYAEMGGVIVLLLVRSQHPSDKVADCPVTVEVYALFFNILFFGRLRQKKENLTGNTLKCFVILSNPAVSPHKNLFKHWRWMVKNS